MIRPRIDDPLGWTVGALWVGWLISWWIASGWASRTVKRAGTAARIRDLALIVPGVILIWNQFSYFTPLGRVLYPMAPATAWALVGCIVLGIAFAWWARLHLGRLWSGNVTIKEGHRIVDTGPYGLVRHPIYTGLLFGIYATAALRANVFAFLGAGLITLGFYFKARVEEKLLTGELGPAYDAYRARVPMLVPFLNL